MEAPSTTPRPVRATRRKIRWIAIAIVLTLVTGGLLYWREIHDVGHPVPLHPPRFPPRHNHQRSPWRYRTVLPWMCR